MSNQTKGRPEAPRGRAEVLTGPLAIPLYSGDFFQFLFETFVFVYFPVDSHQFCSFETLQQNSTILEHSSLARLTPYHFCSHIPHFFFCIPYYIMLVSLSSVSSSGDKSSVSSTLFCLKLGER